MTIVGGEPIAGGYPIAWDSGAGTPSDLYTAAVAVEGQIYLVELFPYQRGATTGATLFVRGIATADALIAYSVPLNPDAGIVEIDYSDSGYTSPNAGDKPNTYFEGRASQPLRLSRVLPVTPESSRRVALEVAGIEIVNADGDMDSLLRAYAIDGRRVVVKFGKEGFRYEQFTPIYTGRAALWKGDLARVQVTARDEAYRLAVPLQSSLYTGAGDADGTSEMTGKPKPITFGEVFNISPVLIDPTNLVYQFHSRTSQAVDAVYDRGAAITPTANHANYAALTGASLSTGEFATCLALGLFRLGSVPSGLVTADVRGDAQGSFVYTTFDVTRRLLTDFAGLTVDELDLPQFDAMTAAAPATMGWFRGTESISAEAALSDIVGHCSAWWGGTTSGMISVGRLTAPDASAIAADLEVYDVADAKIVDPLPGTFPPRFRQRVGSQRRWTIQRGEDLAATVTAARRQYLAEPYSVVSASSAAAALDFLLATDPPVLDSLFVDSSAALIEAERLIALYGVQRQTVVIEQGCEGHLLTLGSTVQLTYPRINGGSPWLARVVGLEIDAGARKVTATLWG